LRYEATELIEKLLDKRADPNTSNLLGETPLQAAIRGNWPGAVKLLLGNQAGGSGCNPLRQLLNSQLCVPTGVIIAQMLMDRNPANLHTPDSRGVSTFQLLTECPSMHDIVQQHLQSLQYLQRCQMAFLGGLHPRLGQASPCLSALGNNLLFDKNVLPLIMGLFKPLVDKPPTYRKLKRRKLA
jgi:hypothetical protein